MNFNSISTSNTTSNNNNNQVLFSLNPKAYLYSCSKTKLNLLDELARQSNISVNVHLSQNTLAKRRGICRVTVNRNISALCEDGVVIKKYNHRHPCDYYLHPLFYDLSFRNAFRNIIMSFKWTPATLMLSENRSIFAYLNSCQLEYVTPLINRNFIKRGKEEGDSPKYNEWYKNQCLSNVKHSKVPGEVTNRKMGVEVMLQSEIKISLLVQEVAKKMKLTEDQEIKLANYPDHIVKLAYGRTAGRLLDNPITYLFKICSLEAQKAEEAASQRPKVVREQPTTQGPIPLRALASTRPQKEGDYQKPQTAIEIAAEIAKIRKMDIKGMYGGEGYRKRMLYNWSDKDYVADGSEAEFAALVYIDMVRVMCGLPPRCPINKPESPRINDNDVGKVMGHSVEKDLTSLIYERNDSSTKW